MLDYIWIIENGVICEDNTQNVRIGNALTSIAPGKRHSPSFLIALSAIMTYRSSLEVTSMPYIVAITTEAASLHAPAYVYYEGVRNVANMVRLGLPTFYSVR